MAQPYRPLDSALRLAIHSSGLSAAELARRSGVHQTTVSRFLHGRNLGIREAAALCRVLGLVLRKWEDE